MPTAVNQRDRILDHALELLSRHGSSGMSMRALAGACDLNVAAIYHYFPSKAELLRSVIEERHYGPRLGMVPELTGSRREVFEALLVEIWEGIMDEEQVWRMLLGESLRQEPTALGESERLLSTSEEAIGQWLSTIFGDVGDRLEALTTVVMGQLHTAFVEGVVRPGAGVGPARDRARALARLVFPDEP